MSQHALLVAAYDSQLKWAMSFTEAFAAHGWTWSVVAPSGVRTALSHAQIRAAGEVNVEYLPWQELLRAARDADAVVLSLQGQLVARFTDELELLRRAEPSAHEPVVVTGWVGIIIEKLVAGYLDRAGSDVVAVNTADNLREFTEAGRWLGIPADSLLLSGLPLLPAAPTPLRSGPIRTVVFADQPTIPTASADRAYIYQRLIEYARLHPERSVILKPRTRPGEGTFHTGGEHPADVLPRLGTLPANFSVSYRPITRLLPATDLMLTVSSTAALEAIGAGVRTAFIGDLGVHEKHGNQVLLRSGLITSFADLEADRLPQANPDWLADVFVAGDLTPVDRVVRRVVELAALPPAERPGRIAAQGRYLSGRISVREHRTGMPIAAQEPRIVQSTAVPQGLRPLVNRVGLALRALLPKSWYVGLLDAWKRRVG